MSTITSGSRRRTALTFAAGAAAVTLVAGCGSSSSSSSAPSSAPGAPSTAPSAPTGSSPAASNPSPSSSALCADVKQLQQSIDKLGTVPLTKDSISQYRADLDAVQQQLSQVTDNGQEALRSELDPVTQAYSALKSSLSDAASNPSSTTFAALGTAAQQFASAARTFGAKVGQGC